MKRLFAIIFLILACSRLGAQDRRWDAALDQYQQICDECIALRNRISAGEQLQMSSVSPLMAQLSDLRNSLQHAGGQMTPAQRLRYESIRMRYDEVFGHRRGAIRIPGLPPICSCAFCLSDSAPVCQNCSSSSPVNSPVNPDNKRTGAPEYGLLFYAGVPDWYFGTMLHLSFAGKPFGAYAKASVSIPYRRGAYECFSDGTTESGFIWTNGKESVSRWSVTAGGTVSPLGWLSLYGGGGYGQRALLWQDVSGNWVKVTDRAEAGFVADAGVIFKYRKLSFLAGVSTFDFSTFSAEFGLGFNF